MPLDTNITPLNRNLPSQYLPNSTFEILVLNMFIENWTLSSDFDSYFTNCNPISCTYTYDERYALIATITVLIGLLGRLSVPLRLILPPCVKLMVSLAHHYSSNDWTREFIFDVFPDDSPLKQNNGMIGAS